MDFPDRETEPKSPFFDLLNNNQIKNTASDHIPRRKNTWLRESITEKTPKAADMPGRTGNTRYRPYSFDVDIQPKALGIINEQLKGCLSVPTIAISLAGM